MILIKMGCLHCGHTEILLLLGHGDIHQMDMFISTNTSSCHQKGKSIDTWHGLHKLTQLQISYIHKHMKETVVIK